MTTYKPTIGIEVHAELNTKSKMFCGCANDPHHSEPNTNICPVCLAHPGTLPVVNREAVEKVLLFGKAINGELADFSEFDRKQYFYPDIPKAYQLSQYAFPFVRGGELAGVAITRVHLEEDTAKSQHRPNANDSDVNANDSSFVDFNRAGVPLMELVTEPVIHSGEDAAAFARELQLLLRTIGISEANMEKGEMRVEANISISPDERLGTKVEVKNLNSFRSVEQAIKFEISRQSEMLAENKPILQETRGWDEVHARTFSQRSKETADDYRYFPDPDIPKYKLSELKDLTESSLSEKLPKLPSEIREYLLNLGLTREQTEVLLYDDQLYGFFNKGFLSHEDMSNDRQLIKLAANYLTSDINGLRIARESAVLDSANAILFVKLMKMLADGTITSRVAKDLLPEVVFEGKDPQKTAKERGLLQNSSTDTLGTIVDQVIAENPTVAADYRSGKEAAVQYLVGQGMKLSKGAANPGLLLSLFKDKLSA